MLILITGVPGTGKSAVSSILAKKIGAEIIDIKELALKGKFILGYDEERGSIVLDEKKISNAIKKFMKKNKKYILDSHLAHFVKPNISKICVILRCNPDVLKERLQYRGYKEEKINENVVCEYLDYILIEAINQGHKKHIHEIDTTKRKASSVADEIISVIKRKKKKSFGNVDWT